MPFPNRRNRGRGGSSMYYSNNKPRAHSGPPPQNWNTRLQATRQTAPGPSHQETKRRKLNDGNVSRLQRRPETSFAGPQVFNQKAMPNLLCSQPPPKPQTSQGYMVSRGPQLRQDRPQIHMPKPQPKSWTQDKAPPVNPVERRNQSRPTNSIPLPPVNPMGRRNQGRTTNTIPLAPVNPVERRNQSRPTNKTPLPPAPPPPPPGKPPLTALLSRNLSATSANQTKPTPTANLNKETSSRKQIKEVPKEKPKPSSAHLPLPRPDRKVPKSNNVGNAEKPAAKTKKSLTNDPKPNVKKFPVDVVDLTNDDAPMLPPGLANSTLKPPKAPRQAAPKWEQRKPNRYKRNQNNQRKFQQQKSRYNNSGRYESQYGDQYERERSKYYEERFYEEQQYSAQYEDKWFDEPYYGDGSYEVNYNEEAYSRADEDFEIDYEKEAGTDEYDMESKQRSADNYQGTYLDDSWQDSAPVENNKSHYPEPAVPRRAETERQTVRTSKTLAPTRNTAPRRSGTPDQINKPVQLEQKRVISQKHTDKRIRRIRRRRQKTPPIVRAPPHLELQEKDPAQEKKKQHEQDLVDMCHRIDKYILEKFGPQKISMKRPKPTIDNPNCYVAKIHKLPEEEILTDFLSEFVENPVLVAIWGRGNVKLNTGLIRNYVVTMKFQKPIPDYLEAAADVGLNVQLMDLQKWLQIEKEKERERNPYFGKKSRPEVFESYPPPKEPSIEPERKASEDHKNNTKGSPSPPRILNKFECENSPDPPSILRKFEDDAKRSASLGTDRKVEAVSEQRSPSPEKTRFSPLSPPPPPPPEEFYDRSRSRSRHRGRDRSRRSHKSTRSRRFDRSKSPRKERRRDRDLTRFPSPKRGPPTEFVSHSKHDRSSTKKKKSEKRKKKTSPLALGFRHWDKSKNKARSRSKSKGRRSRRSRSRDRSRRKSRSQDRRSRKKKKKKKDSASKHSLRDSPSASPVKTSFDSILSEKKTTGVIDLTEGAASSERQPLYDPTLASHAPQAANNRPFDPTKAGFTPVSTQSAYTAEQPTYYDPNHGYYNAAYAQQPHAFQPMVPVAAFTTEERDELLDLLPDLDDDDVSANRQTGNSVLRKITALKEKQEARRNALLAQMAGKLDNFRQIRHHEMPDDMFEQFFLPACGTKEACGEYRRACESFRQHVAHIRED